MCTTAVAATNLMDLYRSLTDSPSRLLPTAFDCLTCRLQKLFAEQRSMPTRQNPMLPSVQRRGQYQYPMGCSTLLRHMAISSHPQLRCNQLGLPVATKCCRASIPDLESRIRLRQYHANDQTTCGHSQLGTRFQREPFATMQAHFRLLLVLL